MPTAPARHPRGYILLAVMLLLAALVLLVAVAQQRAGDEGLTANLERSDSQARALAEAGLERTRAYLGTLLDREADLDRALDPGLDTDCVRLPVMDGVTSDDFLPAFTDGQPVTVASSGKAYLRVPDLASGGAYFVRIDDNDDDAQDTPNLWPATTNNRLGNCLEGLDLGPLRNNPVRDRDAMVWVTVIGIHPGTNLEEATARHTLRVLVGPGEPAGLIAGGTVSMQGSAHTCGAFGDVLATGSIEGGCLCGQGCSTGSPWGSCGPGNVCVGRSAGERCSASFGGAKGECAAGMDVPAPPRASPWEVTQAPLGCTEAPCTTFFYLRLEGAGIPQARLYAWNYATCASPRAGPRICGPSDCAACWVPLDATQKDLDIHVSDADVALRGAVPALSRVGPSVPRIWRADGVSGFESGAPSCALADTGVYPDASGRGRRDTPRVTFEYVANPAPPQSALLPRGVWFVEGNVRLRSFGTPDCAQLSGDPTYRTSIIATGSILHEAGALAFRPASPKGFVLLAGRDLSLRGGGSRIHTCGSSAAVMAHEQVELRADGLVEAQLVAENAAACADAVVGEAVQLSGSATVSVPQLPPLSVGPPVRVRLLSESTH